MANLAALNNINDRGIPNVVPRAGMMGRAILAVALEGRPLLFEFRGQQMIGGGS
jgi:hypothetical protein